MLDQLVVGAAPGDAITLSALRIQAALRRFGPSEIYAQHREGTMADHVGSLEDLAGRPNRGRPLVFHASIGSWPVYAALTEREPELVLVYHNVSPPEMFERYQPDVADSLLRGRWELLQLRDRVVLAFADSNYNARELEDMGYGDICVVPPTPDVGRIVDRRPAWQMLDTLTAWCGEAPLVLTIAQQMPHKRLERVLAGVAVLQQEFMPDVRLAIVGVERFHQYSAALRVMADTVGLHHTRFFGRVTDPELSALFLRARVFVTLSDHEGFCVPVVEAMAAGLPVVTSGAAALPETVGDAGIVVPDPDDIPFVAGVLAEVIQNGKLRDVLGGRGIIRARSMGAEASLARYLDAIAEALPHLVGRSADRRGVAPDRREIA
jgi:glycosyltransferase involved in cell wall biosynthesis